MDETRLDINSATAQELQEALPQLGQQRAEAIVRYREVHGPFRAIEDLQKLPGFGPKLSKAFKDWVAVLPEQKPAKTRVARRKQAE